jgi:hypothetical protein
MENGLKDKYAADFSYEEIVLLTLGLGSLAQDYETRLNELSRDPSSKEVRSLHQTGTLARLLDFIEAVNEILARLLHLTEGKAGTGDALVDCACRLYAVKTWREYLSELDKQKGYSVNDN